MFSLNVPIAVDSIFELTERFIVRAEFVNAADAAVVMLDPEVTEVTIFDDDGE